MAECNLNFIVTDAGIILSKKLYDDWYEVQDDWYDIYKASLGPWSPQDMLDYLVDDYSLNPDEIVKITNWINSESTIFLNWAEIVPLEKRYYNRPYAFKKLFKVV